VNVTCPFFIGLLLLSCIFMLIVLDSSVIAICFCGIMFTSCFCVIVAVFSVFVFSSFIVMVVLFIAPVNAPLCPVTSVMLCVPFLSVVWFSVMSICPSVIVWYCGVPLLVFSVIPFIFIIALLVPLSVCPAASVSCPVSFILLLVVFCGVFSCICVWVCVTLNVLFAWLLT
jgi:hypothetical protein